MRYGRKCYRYYEYPEAVDSSMIQEIAYNAD